MAGEYYRWKYRDEKPEEHRELTPEEKRKNWWDYHKWHVAAGIVLAIGAVMIAWDMLGIGQVEPDYQFAYVGGTLLPDDTVSGLEAALAGLGEDLNGDGQVAVRLNQYPTYSFSPEWENGMADAEAASQAQISEAGLMADLELCDSFFFLLEDPEAFQQRYGILAYPDGSLPEDETADLSEMCRPWEDCPDLAGISADSGEFPPGLFIARRGFWTENTCKYLDGCERLWEKLFRGAAS